MATGLDSGMSKAPTPSFSVGDWQKYIPLRTDPSKEDPIYDGQRIALVRNRWAAQDAALLPFYRQVEENVRMIVGRHWDVWSPVLGQFVDVTRWMTDDERRWRQRPVVNRILHWFILTHARLTENPPIVTFQPSTADRADSLLAEAMDTIFKTLWHELDMLQALDALMAWLIPGGQAFLKSRVDMTQGDDTYVAEPQQDGTFLLDVQKEGKIVVDVLGPMECRGEWGNGPWYTKRWHIHRSFQTPQTVYERYGVMVPPDTFQATNQDGTGGYLTRMQFGSGYFGAAGAKEYGANVQGMGSEAARKEGYVTVDEMWEAPTDAIPEFAQHDTQPGGRLLIVTKEKVLHDSTRPFGFRYTSPIRCFTFVNVPGRPAGTTPQEMINPLQKTYNRGIAQIMEHRNLTTNPILLVDNASGISEGQITNRPGSIIHYNGKPGLPDGGIRYLEPPPLSADVWKTQEFLAETMDFLGNIAGATGTAPTDDPSGIAIKQLRYNSDRFIGPTAKRAVSETVRVVQDWMAILPSLWTEQKVLSYVGDDNVIRMVAIYPDMWEGDIRIEPDMDSMIPEGRAERVQRITTLYQLGAFGPPGSPQASKSLLDLCKFPNMNRVDLMGGVNRVTAQQSMNKLAQGTPAAEIQVFEWYNVQVWQGVFVDYMSSPEFLRLDPNVQKQFTIFLEKLQGAQVAQQIQAIRQAMPMAQMTAAAQGAVAHTAQAHAPQPALPPGGGAGGGGPPQHGGGGTEAGTPGKAALQPVPQPMNTPDQNNA